MRPDRLPLAGLRVGADVGVLLYRRLPVLAVEFLHLHLLDRRVVQGAHDHACAGEGTLGLALSPSGPLISGSVTLG